MKRLIPLFLAALLVTLVSVQSCTVPVDDSDRQRVDELNLRLLNVELAVGEFRSEVRDLNQNLANLPRVESRLDQLNESLAVLAKAAESSTSETTADEISRLVVALEEIAAALRNPYGPEEE